LRRAAAIAQRLRFGQLFGGCQPEGVATQYGDFVSVRAVGTVVDQRAGVQFQFRHGGCPLFMELLVGRVGSFSPIVAHWKRARVKPLELAYRKATKTHTNHGLMWVFRYSL